MRTFIFAAICTLGLGCQGAGALVPVGEHDEALGADVWYDPPRCGPWSSYVCIKSLTLDHNDHLRYQVTLPYYVYPGSNYHLNIQNMPVGTYHQDGNQTGILDVYGAQQGTYWSFAAQTCEYQYFAPQWCGAWTENTYIYVGATGLAWLDSDKYPMAGTSAEAAGWESEGNYRRSLPVCAAPYNNGTHVGKWINDLPGNGTCHFGWGGSEVAVTGSMVLGSFSPVGVWDWAYNGNLPPNAIPGGNERGVVQYICRAWPPAGTGGDGYHPGKTVTDGCNIAYGGREYHVTGYYQVMTRSN